ncbi:hypothetical protein CLOLEP_01807 [[Clostridium] leptum DSM 753]|uniref:Uncharacterized protein n=1 Tax=[Clostridium] leptum DSM 753 TaxID=428125 RepID=A7VTB6_9FIRM|nr:hypothetical protein CLOLEP_01807 [[Clostridium] leptum DSM 753]
MCFGVLAVEVILFVSMPENRISCHITFDMGERALFLMPMYAVLASGVRFGRVFACHQNGTKQEA